MNIQKEWERIRAFLMKYTNWIALFVFGLMCLIIIVSLFNSPKHTYSVIDYDHPESGPIDTFDHFLFAESKMYTTEGDRIVVVDSSGKVLAAKNAVVSLKNNQEDHIVHFTNKYTKVDEVVNGDYAADALYLDTSADGSRILFEIAGVQGWADAKDVELVLYTEDLQLSYYYRYENSLVHCISQDMNEDVHTSYSIGPCPKYVKEDVIYYSYNGHWFYDDFYEMYLDKQAGSHQHAVNQIAHYCFYQYLPYRSYTELTPDDFNNHITEMTGIVSSDQSVLYNSGYIFIDIQNQTGVNAAMMFASAVNDSGYGQSELAISSNNIFGHQVYSREGGADGRYNSLYDCIYQHAYYFVQGNYSNPSSDTYHGSWFGDKDSGIALTYSGDPYWGEKNASIYYQIDRLAGMKDYKEYKTMTFRTDHDIVVYSDPKNKNELYRYESGETVSFIILGEEGSWYKIYSEVPITNYKADPTAQYIETIAYIRIKDVV